MTASRVARWLPGLAMLRQYQRGWLRGDVVGGLTVGAMLVPHCVAYADLAGMPARAGFQAALGALVVYALVGTSRHLGAGPEPGTALLAAAGVGALAAGDVGRYAALMAVLALLVGAVCVLASLLRLGFIAAALSRPVLVGYLTGVGLTLISSQLAPLLGLPGEGTRVLPRLREVLGEIDAVHVPTLAVGASSLAAILLLRRLSPSFPGGLLVVALATVVVVAAGFDDEGIAVVGAVPSGVPTVRIPSFVGNDVVALLPVAAGIALVGFTDNLLTARSIAMKRRETVEPNQELLALGVTNVAAGISGGFPVSSSASRTAVAASLGSTTQLVSIVAAACVVASLTAAHSLLGNIPRPALAAVVVAAALTILDLTGLRAMWRIRRQEAALAVAAAAGVVFFDVLVGIGIAVGLSMLVALAHIARPHDAVLGDAAALDGWVDIDAHPGAVIEPGLVVYRFDAPLLFVNASHYADRVMHVLAENAGAEEWLVLDFEGVGMIDVTAIDVLGVVLERVDALGVVQVSVARANSPVLDLLARGALLAPEGPLTVYPTINAAVRAFRRRTHPDRPHHEEPRNGAET